MKRRLKLVAVLLASGLSGIAAFAVASRIETLLPPEGASRCFSGSYNGSTALNFGFHSEKRTDEAHVTRLVLKLDRQSDQEPHRDPQSPYHFDWRYDFRLLAETSDQGSFHTGGQCDWLEDAVAHVQPAIYCFIDCDGGGIEVRRTPARQGVDVVWDADGWLKMSSCGGGGEILRAGANSKTFRLVSAADTACDEIPPVE